jgi:putative transposase
MRRPNCMLQIHEILNYRGVVAPGKFGRRPPRLDEVFQRYDSPVYFVTFCTHGRKPFLASKRTHSAFIEFARRAVEFNVAVGRYVIMPDHVHLFVCGDDEFVLSRWIADLKQSLARANRWSRKNGQIWQEGFFDHMLRNEESMNAKWEYIVQNPLRAGLVTNPEEWPYQGEIVSIDRA